MAWQRALVILSIWTGRRPPHLFLLATATALLIGGWPALSPFPLHAQEKGLPACGVPVPGDDDWEIAEPTAGSAPASKLCELARYLDSTPQDNIHGVVVVQAGRLVFEKYLEGEDQRWGVPLGVTMHGPTVRHDVRAVTNSVISLLVGIAIDRQLIVGVDQPVFDFFPEYAALRTPEKDRILLRHLLTMSSGLAWNENVPYGDSDNSERLMAEAEDPYRYVLEQPVRSPPDRVWNYNSGGTQLLEGMLRAAVKQPVDAFAGEALFAPLGITDLEWIRMPNDQLAAASGLRLRPRDMAKLGQLYLDNGKWRGRQIVSAAWLQESAKPRVSSSYGYQWWTGLSVVGEKVVERIEARGWGGQRIFIVPSSDLVVVVTAGMYIKRGIYNEGEITAGILDNYVLPAVLAEQAARLP